MSTDTQRADAAPTRRERQRQATYSEIVAAARKLLRAAEPISLRGIAQEMGITPPALYRYVEGYDELVMLVSRSVLDEVVACLAAARDAHPADDPAAQLVASAVAFRRWAMSHREEFGLVFANRSTSDGKRSKEPGGAGFAFHEFFSDIYLRVWDRYEFDVPRDEELPPGVAEGLGAQQQSADLACLPGMPVGLLWVFLRAWSRLYGTVTLEVFGHLDVALIESGAIFVAMMEDNGRELNLGDDWPRLQEQIRADLTQSTS